MAYISGGLREINKMKEQVPAGMIPELNDELDRLLEFAIVHLLQTRQPFAVLDVSEAALAIGGDAWSALLKLGRVPTLVSLN